MRRLLRSHHYDVAHSVVVIVAGIRHEIGNDELPERPTGVGPLVEWGCWVVQQCPRTCCKQLSAISKP
jgi:hypothetical protein